MVTFLKKLFSGNNSGKECPRCLGKGHIDWDDIKRLNQELKWMPGACAYCNGTGRVDSNVEGNVPVDASYLVTNVPEAERKRMLNGDPEALQRGRQYEEQMENFIEQIRCLHFERNLGSEQIAEFVLIGREDSDTYHVEKKEMVGYIENIIKRGKPA